MRLNAIQGVIRNYCRALSGRDIEVHPLHALVERQIGWTDIQQPTTDGCTIYLPDCVDQFPTEKGNFSFYKVMATHQNGHIEFNSFDFNFDRPSVFFDDLRPELSRLPDASSLQGRPSQSLNNSYTRFFSLFRDRHLIHDIFTIVEDTRIDCRIKEAYPGLQSDYFSIQKVALQGRPNIHQMPLLDALIEFMIQLSLDQPKAIWVPQYYRETVSQIASLIRMVRYPEAKVEDTAEAALRIYCLLAGIGNIESDPSAFIQNDLSLQDQYVCGTDGQRRMDRILITQCGGQEVRQDPSLPPKTESARENKLIHCIQKVDYRGSFKPELAQLLWNPDSILGSTEEHKGGLHVVKKELESLVKKSVEVEIVQDDKPQQLKVDQIVDNLNQSLKDRESDAYLWQDETEEGDAMEGSLLAAEPYMFTYDEWNYIDRIYKSRHCFVEEKEIAEGGSQFLRDVLAKYARLIYQIKRQFEYIRPEAYSKVTRLQDGQSFDLDAVVEAMIDYRVGTTPSEKLYIRRNKRLRNVAVAFLMDMSASTAETIDCFSSSSSQPSKRIIDLEKEALILLTHVLQILNDKYAIFGFSGYGRKNVEFYLIKEFGDRLTEKIAARIDSIRPLYATRMGAAIRHATFKLKRQTARTRFLFMISDGRPQDWGYSCEGRSKKYAINDTRMALLEARRQGITPFCLTVDRNGHDYLRSMMKGMDYEVLSDIRSLPSRLPMVYRRLTSAA